MPRKSSQHEQPIGGFASVELLGSGSFADVYKARDELTNQAVALKVLHGTVRELGRNSTFELETRALGTLSAHPNIVTLYRSQVLPDGRPMLVLELCDQSLYDMVRRSGPLHPQVVVRIGIQVSGALETAHRSGILHRDIKPQNVLVSRYGVAQLADFGVADMRNSSGQEYAVSGLSVLHAPPEVLFDKGATAQSDVYALASSMYELLCGRAPFFMTQDESPAAVRLRVLNDAPPTLNIPDMPPKLWEILRRAMSKEPSERHETALEFALDLRALEKSAGWAETECVVEGVTAMPTPDPERLRTRLTGAVVSGGLAPDLGDLGRGFRTSSPGDEQIEALEPVAPSLDRYFVMDSPSSVAESTTHEVTDPQAVVDAPVPPDPSVPVTFAVEQSTPADEAGSREQGLLPSLFAPLSDADTADAPIEDPTDPVEVAPLRTLSDFPTWSHVNELPQPGGAVVTDPPIGDDDHEEDPHQPAETNADNPAAVPGEVLWGHSPRVGLTGTIELSQTGRLSGSRPQEDESKETARKSRFGRARKRG